MSFVARRALTSLRSVSSRNSQIAFNFTHSAPALSCAVPSFRRLSTDSKANAAPEDTSMKGKLVGMWKKYGYIAIGTYLGMYATTLSSLFLFLEFDVLNAASVGFDPVETIKRVCDLVATYTGYESLPMYIKENPAVGKFAIAWVMTKFTEPFRLAITVGIVPRIAKFIRGRDEHDEHDKKI